MELVGSGKSISIGLGSKTLIGREQLGLGSPPRERLISRHHVSLQLLEIRENDDIMDTDNRELQVSFEVIGKNPILVVSKDLKRKRIYRKSEKGVLKEGDKIALLIKCPNFFTVKRREGKEEDVESGVFDAVARRERRTQQRRKEAAERAEKEAAGGDGEDLVWEGFGLGIGSLDILKIDPWKEFGFLVRGHEFDHYPRRKLRPFKEWNWFLEDTRSEISEDDEEDEAQGTKSKGRSIHRKRKKGGNFDDDDWTKDCEEENNLSSKTGHAMYSSISTRSKDPKNPQDTKKTTEKAFNSRGQEDDNDEDETLGGFVVGDDDIEEEDKELVEEEDEIEEDDESDLD